MIQIWQDRAFCFLKFKKSAAPQPNKSFGDTVFPQQACGQILTDLLYLFVTNLVTNPKFEKIMFSCLKRPDHQVRSILKKRKLYPDKGFNSEFLFEFIRWETSEFKYYDDRRDFNEWYENYFNRFNPQLFAELFDSPELSEEECSPETYQRQQQLIKQFNERKRLNPCWEFPWYCGIRRFQRPEPRDIKEVELELELKIMQDVDDEFLASQFDKLHPDHFEVIENETITFDFLADLYE